MKKTKKLMILGLALTMSSNVWAQNLIETSNVIDSQTKITKGYIDNLLEKINQKKVDTRFNAKDYLDQSQETKNKVESTLSAFEIVLEKDILTKAAFWMDQYNAIYKSKDYSSEQKNILLSQRYINIQKQAEVLSKAYQAAIKSVYELVPYGNFKNNLILSIEKKTYDPTVTFKETILASMDIDNKTKISLPFTMENRVTKDDDIGVVEFRVKNEIFGITKNNSLQPNYNYIENRYELGIDFDRNQKTNTTFFRKSSYYFLSIDYVRAAETMKVSEIIHDEIYNKYFYKKMKGSCMTSICLGLKAGEYTSLLVMIKQLIDRNIELQLADGKTLVLKKLDQDTRPTLNLLSNVNYPEELPFDI